MPSRSASPPAAAVLPSRLGPFAVQRELGRGSAGVVYLAEQDWPARRVALKVFHRGLTSDADRRRFDNETDALARLSHPGIAHLYQPGFVTLDGDERPYLAMELVHGLPLRTWRQRSRPDVRTCVHCLVAICEAIDAAHRQGVVHRDLKPENILVEAGPDGVRPRVLDFGVAKLLADTGTPDTDDLVGTLDYMSPEQVMRSPLVDGRSDVYSLGAIAYELLGGRLPLRAQGRTWADARACILQQEPAPLARIAPGLDADLACIVHAALAKSPAARPPTPGDLARDLQAWLDARPISLRPATPWYRFRCFARRQRLLLLSGALTAASLVLAAVTGWWAYAGSRADVVRIVRTSQFTVEHVLDRLRTLAGTTEVRRDALAHLLPQVDECARLQPDDIATLQCQERILRLLGDIEVEAGRWAAAAPLRRRAEATCRTLVALQPHDPMLRADHATALVRCGDCDHQLGAPALAKRRYHEAHATFRALAAAHPDVARLVDDLAWSCDRLAHPAIDAGDFATATALLDERDRLNEQLDALRPGSCINLAGRRAVLCLRAHLAHVQGRHAERQAFMARAIEPALAWWQRHPNDAAATTTFVSTVISYVGFPHERVDPATATPLVASASEALDRLLVLEPENHLARELQESLSRWRAEQGR